MPLLCGRPSGADFSLRPQSRAYFAAGGLRGKNRVGEIVKLLEQNERHDVL